MDSKIKELRTKDLNELRSEVLLRKREYASRKLKFRLGTDKKSSVLKYLRKEVARLMTVIKEKEILERV